MIEPDIDEEREALRAAQSELDRSNKRRTEIKVWALVMGATFALVVAGFVGWYLGSR